MADEFLINTYGRLWQQHPDVTRLADGSIVVVWDSYFSEEGVKTYYTAMQRFTANGRRLGGEQVLAAFSDGQSTHPSVAALKDGGFAVAWQIAAGDSILGQEDVYTNTFDADGTRRGDATRAHAASRTDQFAPGITATADGGFALTWSSEGGQKAGPGADVFLRRYDADGVAIGAGVRVNAATQFDQHNSRVVKLSNGNLLVVWDSEYGGDSTPGEAAEDGVRARLYTAGGRAIGREFVLAGRNDGADGSINTTDSRMDAAALPDGRFVVTWYETVLRSQDDITYEIHAQIYANNGDPLGREILVRGGSVSTPDHSAVTALAGGGFVVAWDAFGRRSFDLEEVWARVYDANGRPLGPEFRVNAPSGQTAQDNPELQALPDGGFWVVYESDYLDGDDEAIAGRIYRNGSFGADVQTLDAATTYRALSGADHVTGSLGADTVLLGRGDDLALGEAGDDVLRGGLGADRLDGGAGADRYVYGRAEASLAGTPDTVVLEAGQDRIDLSRLDADVGTTGRQAFAWIGDAAFTGRAGELRFADGTLAADLDGDAQADFAIRVKGDAVTAAELIL